MMEATLDGLRDEFDPVRTGLMWFLAIPYLKTEASTCESLELKKVVQWSGEGEILGASQIEAAVWAGSAGVS